MDATLQYIPIMIVGFAAALGLTPISRQIAMRLGVVDKPTLPRKLHKDHKPMMGGLAIYMAFAISLALFSPESYLGQLGAIILGAGLLALLGLADDRFNLAVRIRFGLMMLVSGILVLVGLQVRLTGLPWLDIPLTIVWVVALVNATNFLDNMDGLTAGLSAVAAGFFLLIGLVHGNISVTLMAAALFGSAVGFLTYNFNPASTFMGDMGALVMGFVLATLAIMLEFNAGISLTWLVPVMILALPIFDINLVIWTRILEGRSPFEGGRDHTSHRLLALGFSPRQTLFILYGMCTLFGFTGLLISSAPSEAAGAIGAAGLLLLAGLFAFMVWVRERYQKTGA